MKNLITLLALSLIISTDAAELCNSAQWQRENAKSVPGWKTNDFKGETSIKILEGNICQIMAESFGRGYVSWQGKCYFPADTTFRFSGKYRTSGIEFLKGGFISAKLVLNPGAERQNRKSRELRLAPSADWESFSAEVMVPFPTDLCSLTFMLYKAKGTVEFTNLKLEQVEKNKGQLSPEAITIWRECEDVFTGGGLAPGGPGSGRGKQYISQGQFSYRFKPLAETDPATLLPLPRKFYIWARIYGYVDKTQVDVALDNKKIYSFDTRNTEKMVNNRMSGEYYWQCAGSFTTVGAPHELTFTGKKRMCFDALVFTTDPSYVPMDSEAQKFIDNKYFTDLKLPVSIQPLYPVNGIAVNCTLPLTFRFTTPGRRKIYQKGTVKLELPPGVELIDAVSHWSARNWKSEEKIVDYLKIRTQKTQDGGTHCEIDLSCISLELNVFLRADKNLLGKRIPLHYSFELGENKQPSEEIYLEVLQIKETRPFKKILIGTEESFQGFFSDFPDLFDTYRKSGMNLMVLNHYHRSKNPAVWGELSTKAKATDTTLATVYSPRYPFSYKEGRAMGIDGKYTQLPSLLFKPDSPWDKKDLDALAELGKDFDILILDDENTNRRGDMIDYHPEVLAAFAEFLKEKHLPEVDIKQVVQEKQFDSEAYLSWVDFKCELMADHYKYYAEAAKRYNPQAYILPRTLKDTSTAELRRTSYWDYRKLLKYCPRIIPMIYTYMGIRDSDKVGEVMDMHNSECGRPIISTYLLSEHFDFGIVRPENKPMIKYQIWESLMGQAKHIMFFSGTGTFNPVNLRYVAEGVDTALPYEDFFCYGKPVTIQAKPEWLRVRALEYNGKLLIYFANYANDRDKTGEILLPDGRRIPVDFQKDRAGFILTETSVN